MSLEHESFPPPDSDDGMDDETAAPWSAWEPFDFLIGLAMVIVGGIVVLSLAVGIVGDGEPRATLTGLFAQGIVFMSVPLILASMRTKDDPARTVGFNRFKARDIWLVAAAFGLQIAATVLVSTLLITPEQDTIVEDANFTATSLATVLTVISIVIVAPIAEETLFRGLFFGSLRNLTNFWVAAIGSGVLFGAVHLTNGDFAVAGLLSFFGVLLAWLYDRTGSLGPPIMLHMVNNALAVIPLLT